MSFTASHFPRGIALRGDSFILRIGGSRHDHLHTRAKRNTPWTTSPGARCARWSPPRRCTRRSSPWPMPRPRVKTVPEEQQFTIPEAMDVMIRWFCLLFGDQFTRGRCARPLSRRPAHARRGAGASGRADADHRASSMISLRPRQRRRRRRTRPDAAGVHLFHLQLAAREPAGAWTRSTAWTCRAF